MAKTTKENIIIKKNSRYDRLRRTGQVLVASDRKEHTRWFIFFLSDVWNRYMFLSRRDMKENLMFRFFFRLSMWIRVWSQHQMPERYFFGIPLFITDRQFINLRNAAFPQVVSGKLFQFQVPDFSPSFVN